MGGVIGRLIYKLYHGLKKECVDVSLFSPSKRTRYPICAAPDQFVIGTVKILAPVYGIRHIIEALAIIVREHPEIPIVARIAGNGHQKEELVDLAYSLGVNDRISWLGFITQEEAAVEWASMDIAVIPSIHESFGVAAVEAQACGVPVVISGTGGLMEATMPGQTSIVVTTHDSRDYAEEIVRLYQNMDIRDQMSKAARSFVEQKYEYNQCFMNIQSLFEKYAQ